MMKLHATVNLIKMFWQTFTFLYQKKNTMKLLAIQNNNISISNDPFSNTFLGKKIKFILLNIPVLARVRNKNSSIARFTD